MRITERSIPNLLISIGNPAEEIQDFVVVDGIGRAEFLGELVDTPDQDDVPERDEEEEDASSGESKHGQVGDERHTEIKCTVCE